MTQASLLENAFPGLRRREPVDGMTRMQQPTFPRTQDQVMIVAARDNCLVLRDHSVVAGVGVGSVDDALLSDRELDAKLEAFKDMLNQLRFDVQMLIGTRPQNLDAYRARWVRYSEGMAERRAMLVTLRDGIPQFMHDVVAAMDVAANQGLVLNVGVLFERFFGFAPLDLDGLPGDAADIAASHLSENEFFAELLQAQRGDKEAARETRETNAAKDTIALVAGHLANRVDVSVRQVDHWERLILSRGSFVEEMLQAMQAPVRVYHLIITYNPRLIVRSVKRGPMEEHEFATASEELSGRCDMLARSIARMGLPAWRASQQELLADVRHFYHPAERGMTNREERYKRSAVAQMATVRGLRTAHGTDRGTAHSTDRGDGGNA